MCHVKSVESNPSQGMSRKEPSHILAKFWDPSFNKKGIATAYVMFMFFLELKSKKKMKKHHSTNGSTKAGFCWVKLRNDAS